ncbi:hypothetical protein ARMGADRAFT_480519 [Armillaria gallica]|uniref:Uncharacterized protein n=1 Tax=Armillaria gallica TaxID=47427 RepID=A0A2H3DCI9_ARMGA|nr:hypothetical protein ARMGADRAFT_480519 [Armillaria gallica]
MPGCSLSSLCRSLSVHQRNVPHPVSEMDGTTIDDNGSKLWRLVSRRWEGCIGKKRFLGMCAYAPSDDQLQLCADGMYRVPTAKMHGTTKLAVAEENIATQSGKRGTINEHFDVVVAQPLSKVGGGQGARR